MFLKPRKDFSICWWCGSSDLTSEHKVKKTDIEMLYGKTYRKGNRISHIKYLTESRRKDIQSSTSKRLKFSKNLCKECNGSRSQKFDKSYERFMKYLFENRVEVMAIRKIDLEQVFGNRWKEHFQNVKRYIGKHVGCRMAENGLLPSSGLIWYLNGGNYNMDLKIVFQLKPYQFGDEDNPIDMIYLGPANPINYSVFDAKGLVTSFCGWYTCANITWNYLHEKAIRRWPRNSKEINLYMTDYSKMVDFSFEVNLNSTIRDVAFGLEELEYYPFKGESKDIEHYTFMKKIKVNY